MHFDFFNLLYQIQNNSPFFLPEVCASTGDAFELLSNSRQKITCFEKHVSTPVYPTYLKK